jgi:putative proteasome-type protease
MTYCVALRLDRGLVFAADTRTSAGNDNVAHYRKLHYWRRTGERVVVLAAAGNLAVTQSVISLLNERLVEELSPGAESLFNVPSLYRAARLVGSALREVWQLDGPSPLAIGATKPSAHR